MIKHNIILPSRNGEKSTEEIEMSNNLVLIGANGSGKTRLGVFIEEKLQQNITVHRISAQKALKLPDYAQIKNLGQAQDEFLVGYSGTALKSNGIAWAKNNYRWQNQSPATSSLNDYEQLLSLLFAKTTERDRLHTENTRAQKEYLEVLDSVTDKIVKIWSDLMPHRSIKFSDGQVLISKKDQKEYHGKDMSDGERVVLYLIGSCLCAPDNSIIIIDEPEVHIHKSIISKLWNKIEDNCPEKLIIYITHDLDFATSRSDATKLWLKAYHGENIWEWDFIPVEESFPENLYLEILGNRKDVIFCEGENNSIDISVYQYVYPEYHIIPRGGGDKVIESTKAFVNNLNLHHLVAHGIIDSDYKESKEKEILQGHGIFTIPVAEIENLYCIEPILKIISIHLGLDPDETFSNATNFIIESLKKEFDVQVSTKAEKVIEYKLGAFSKKDHTIDSLKSALNETVSRINIDEIYEISRKEFQDAIDSRDYAKILLIYNRKSLPTRISSIFGLAKGEYEKLLVRLMKGDKKEEIVNALKAYLPNFK